MLQIGDGATSPGSLPGNVTIGTLGYTTTNGSFTANGLLIIDTPAGMSLTASGNISGSGSSGLTKTGAGLALLTGSNSYSGATTVSQGTLDAYNPLSSSSYSVAAGAGPHSANQQRWRDRLEQHPDRRHGVQRQFHLGQQHGGPRHRYDQRQFHLQRRHQQRRLRPHH